MSNFTIEDFVNREVLYNQNELVEELIKTEAVSYDEIENLYEPITEEMIQERIAEFKRIDAESGEVPAGAANPEGATDEENREWAIEELEANAEPQEIFTWYLVTERLYDALKAKGCPVLQAYGCSWWGRTTYGQMIVNDSEIQDIYQDIPF